MVAFIVDDTPPAKEKGANLNDGEISGTTTEDDPSLNRTPTKAKASKSRNSSGKK